MNFTTCKKVWPKTKILLCLWHVKKTWDKQTCVKVRCRPPSLGLEKHGVYHAWHNYCGLGNSFGVVSLLVFQVSPTACIITIVHILCTFLENSTRFHLYLVTLNMFQVIYLCHRFHVFYQVSSCFGYNFVWNYDWVVSFILVFCNFNLFRFLFFHT